MITPHMGTYMKWGWMDGCTYEIGGFCEAEWY